jgi:SAM-dependent methyltransferase
MKREPPAAARNRQAILEVLQQHLPKSGLVLEIASGSGTHVAHFAKALPHLAFQPSDPDSRHHASIAAWAADVPNIRAPLLLDATDSMWPIQRADAVLCINMIHISPWASAEGLMRGAGRMLPAGGLLYLYGPFRRDGAHTAPSNEAFDQDLRRENPEWGVRDLEAVTATAAANGFAAPEILAMPANNLSLVFRKR